MNEHFNVSAERCRSTTSTCRQGAFVTHAGHRPRELLLQHQGVRERAACSTTPTRSSGARTSRLDIIHRPLSDIYLVYNERHDSRTGALIDRALIAKMTYLIAF